MRWANIMGFHDPCLIQVDLCLEIFDISDPLLRHCLCHHINLGMGYNWQHNYIASLEMVVGKPISLMHESDDPKTFKGASRLAIIRQSLLVNHLRVNQTRRANKDWRHIYTSSSKDWQVLSQDAMIDKHLLVQAKKIDITQDDWHTMIVRGPGGSSMVFGHVCLLLWLLENLSILQC